MKGMDPISSKYDTHTHHVTGSSKNEQPDPTRIESFSPPKTLPVLLSKEAKHIAEMNAGAAHFLLKTAFLESSPLEDTSIPENIPTSLQKSIVELLAQGTISCLQR